jgi:hypothetical protein
MRFLSNRFSRVGAATTAFNACASRRKSSTSSKARRVASKPPFTGLKELLRPPQDIDEAMPLAAAQLGYGLLPAQPFQYDADLLFS